MRKVALTRGLPPRWLGAAVAGIFGAACAMLASDVSGAIVAATVCILWPVFFFGRRHLKAMARRSSYGFNLRLLAVQLTLVLLLQALLVAGKLGRAEYGWSWAPLAAGLAVAATIYAVFEYKRATFAAHAAREEGA